MAANNSFDAFTELGGPTYYPAPTPAPITSGRRVPPTAPFFYGKPDSQLTELEQLQCRAYRRDLEEYNQWLSLQGTSGEHLLAVKDAEIASLERELRQQAEQAQNAKQVVLYFSPLSDKAVLNDQLIRIQELLGRKGISEIVIADATKHPDLQELLQDPTKEFPIPLIVIRGSPIGDFRDLQRLEDVGKLEPLLEGSLRITDIFIQNPDAPELQLGAIGTVLNAGESIVSGVGSLLYMPVSLLSWTFGANQTAPPPKPEGEEFTVVNTNWYGRELHRIFRFTNTHIERVHPTTKLVRASFPYSAISKIVCQDEKNIIIHYNDQQEYIRCPAKDIDRIIQLIVLHHPSDIPIEGRK